MTDERPLAASKSLYDALGEEAPEHEPGRTPRSAMPETTDEGLVWDEPWSA